MLFRSPVTFQEARDARRSAGLDRSEPTGPIEFGVPAPATDDEPGKVAEN
jgi:hypothetical protein